jgi:hypothetical protein
VNILFGPSFPVIARQRTLFLISRLPPQRQSSPIVFTSHRKRFNNMESRKNSRVGDCKQLGMSRDVCYFKKFKAVQGLGGGIECRRRPSQTRRPSGALLRQFFARFLRRSAAPTTWACMNELPHSAIFTIDADRSPHNSGSLQCPSRLITDRS